MGKKKPSQQHKNQQQVFVSGIPYSANQQQLRDILCKDGGQQLVIKLPKFQDTGRCLGYAHIECTSKQAYEDLLNHNKCIMDGRYLIIEAARGRKPPPQQPKVIPTACRSIFLKNLPYGITQQQIRELCATCGVVQDVRMVYNSLTKKFKGFAYVDFRDVGSTRKAISKLSDKAIQGRHLQVDVVTTSHKKGYKRHNFYEDNNRI